MSRISGESLTGVIDVSLKAFFLCTAAAFVLGAPAHANPVGGAVTTGSASISSTSSRTTVDQTSEGVVIDWNSFDIGSGQTTQFVQPNAQAIAVNRIGSASASKVLGTLDANGNVVLINGNGILFGKGSKVDVGSLIATTTDGSDSDLLVGKFAIAGNQNASIINKGVITTANRGTVALVAPNVSNTGTIKAKLGTVALGAANAFTIDFNGDGLVSFAAQGDVNGPASSVNKGRMVGANVSMTANAAEGIATSVVSTSGVIRAESVHQAGGTILLDAGAGTLTTSGTIDAAGKTGGGSVETSGANVAIAGAVTAGKGGVWKVDPDDLTVDSTAAMTIDNSLDSGTSVELQTTASGTSGPGNPTPGVGNIDIDSALSWSTSSTLTIDAYHSINVLAPISITGAGSLVLQYNDEGTDGVLNFGLGPTGFAGDVSYGTANNGGTLSINGTPYTLLYSMDDIENIDNNLSGTFALADSLDASDVTGWTPLGETTAFTGTFNGLGNTISNLTMSSNTPNTGLGMFGVIRAPGIVENFGLIGGSVSTSATGIGAGELAGYNNGVITNAYATGWVTGNGSVQYLGGLVGGNEGTITNGYATGAVTNSNNGSDASDIGGLAGTNGGAVTNSYASGTVLGGSNVDAGGLIGSNSGAIANAYTTGTATITGNNSIVGGLVGSSNYQSSTIMDAYATGAVSATASGDGVDGVGGLSGVNDGTITDAYAIGTVTANGSNTGVGGLIGMNGGAVTDSFATGAVSGGLDSSIGGLVGINLQNTIADAYAAGAVSGTDASYIGGLVGSNDGKIVDTYAIGTVTDTGGGAHIGGLVGTNGKNISYSYWDTATSGQSTSAAGKGESTAELQAALAKGFSSTVWSILPGVSFPYFSWQFAGTPQVVSGYVRNGAVAEPGMAVDLLVNGSEISPAIATTSGANGYFYLLLQPGSISSSGSNVLAYIDTSGTTGNTFGENLAGSVGNIVIKNGILELNADAADSSSLMADLDQAVGSNGGAQLLFTTADGFAQGTTTVIDDTASVFTIDSNLDIGTGTLAIDASGQIEENVSTGAITARVLSGKSVGGASFGGSNLIQLLGAFTNTGAGGFSLVDDRTLAVDGAVDAGTDDLQLTTSGAGSNISINADISANGTITLDSSGGISESASKGIITANALTGGSAAAVSLGGANQIVQLTAFSGTGGNFALTDNRALTVDGTVDFSARNIALTTTAGDLTIGGAIDASTLTLVSDLGEVTGTGAVTAKVLNVIADTGIDLTGSNNIKKIGTNHTSSGPDVINQ